VHKKPVIRIETSKREEKTETVALAEGERRGTTSKKKEQERKKK
jgi:hypothetical protein